MTIQLNAATSEVVLLWLTRLPTAAAPATLQLAACAHRRKTPSAEPAAQRQRACTASTARSFNVANARGQAAGASHTDDEQCRAGTLVAARRVPSLLRAAWTGNVVYAARLREQK
jgi:uncharacterized lipoprotein YajG